MQKNGALEGAESHKTKKSAAIAKRVKENRREEEKEGMSALCLVYDRGRVCQSSHTTYIATLGVRLWLATVGLGSLMWDTTRQLWVT